MKRREFFKGAGAATVMAATAGTISSCTSENKLKSGEIYHTVQFDLKYPVGSAEAENFIKDGVRILTAVPGVCRRLRGGHHHHARRHGRPPRDRRTGQGPEQHH